MLARLAPASALFLPLFLVSLLSLLVPGVLAIDVKVVAASRKGGKYVDPASIKLLSRPINPSQLERLNGTGNADGARRSGNPVGYSGNWCGASQHTTTSDRFTSVEAYLTAPDLSLRSGQGTPQFVAAWVGIDGASCNTALVQAGATTEISSTGAQTSSLWFEWIPDAAYGISNLPVSPGDTIYIKVSASSSSAATILVENLSLPPSAPVYSVQVSLTNGSALCRTDAEWIVENFIVNGNQTPFAKFSDIWFQGCEAKTASSNTIDIDGATMIYLQNNGPDPNCFAYEYDNSIFWAESS